MVLSSFKRWDFLAKFTSLVDCIIFISSLSNSVSIGDHVVHSSGCHRYHNHSDRMLVHCSVAQHGLEKIEEKTNKQKKINITI